MDIADLIAETLRADPAAEAMAFDGRWWRYSQLAAFAEKLAAALADVPADAAIGLVARNRPSHAAAVLALLGERRPVSMIYAFQSETSLAADIAGSAIGYVLIDESDWSESLGEALSAACVMGLVLAPDPDAGLRVIPARGDRLCGHEPRRLPGPGIEILSSGTTGAPKRIFHGVDMLFRSLEGTLQNPVEDEAPTPVFWPLGGIGGNLQLASAVIERRRFIVFEKFTVAGLVDAIQRHRMTSIALTPTMLRMIYDADVPPEALTSLVAFFGGSGPLDPDLQDRVEARYGKPVIWALGATEFCGTAIAWTLDLHAAYAATKRGSAGRPLPGCQVRIMDPDTDALLGVNEVGRMEILVERQSGDWIRTTDLALIDADGFVFHRGRADGAIIRGGFKIIPEKISEALRLHPDVAEAAVIGSPDERLGEVPVAVVERRAGADALDVSTLDRHLRDRLAAPQIPVRFILVDALPYTASTKVDLGAVRDLVALEMAETPAG